MSRWRSLGISLLFVLAAPALAAAEEWEVHPEWAEEFSSRGVSGTMLVFDTASQRYQVFDRKRADTAYAPASTFKIFNALTALETGAVKDEFDIFRWDGKKRWSDDWNRDHDLASGMKHSVVWYYQELARRIGEERMQAWIDKVGYGNRDISGGIDLFWLGTGGLKISATQQIAFLRRLAAGDLPFSARSQEVVRRIITTDAATDHVLYAKTGWTSVEGQTDLGWYVGWVQRGDRRWFFALNIDMPKSADGKLRVPIAHAILKRIGALPAGAA